MNIMSTLCPLDLLTDRFVICSIALACLTLLWGRVKCGMKGGDVRDVTVTLGRLGAVMLYILLCDRCSNYEHFAFGFIFRDRTVAKPVHALE